MRIDWSVPAATDLDHIFDYIARDSATYAERFVDRILESVARLADQPAIGRAVQEADSEDIRELIVAAIYSRHGTTEEKLAAPNRSRLTARARAEIALEV